MIPSTIAHAFVYILFYIIGLSFYSEREISLLVYMLACLLHWRSICEHPSLSTFYALSALLLLLVGTHFTSFLFFLFTYSMLSVM